jgi:glycosyltransferase involved in cell wall biosynthesis
MRVALVTVGDTARLTGGYLYHRVLLAGLRAAGIAADEIVAAPADLAAQLAARVAFAQAFDPRPYNLIIVDALARGVCGPLLDEWRRMRPVVAFVHELPSVAANQPVERAREAPLLRCDRLVAVSAHGRSILIERGAPPERIVVVSPGCDRVGTQRLDASTSGSNQVQGLCVAQWIARKGIVELVEAWLGAAAPGAQLDLVGEPGADAAYGAQVQALLAAAPPGRIRVLGAINDAALVEGYARADLFVLPSRYEGYGMAYAEALHYGLPIIACAVGPVPELVGNAGLLVPPDDHAALRGAIAHLTSDGKLRAQLAARARRRAAALPTWRDSVQGWQRVIIEVIAEHQAR